MRNMFQLILE